MSDSMIQAMERMNAIRSRIQEIQQLTVGKSAQSGADAESAKVDSSRFAMLLQEAAGSLSADSTADTSAQQLLSELTGGAEGLGALSSLGSIDPALIARALEQYRSQK